MTLLVSGVILWVVVHLMPSVAPGLRQSLVDKLGNNAYRGIFALVIVSSVVLIVIGWRATPEVFLYRLPDWARVAGFVLMILSFALIGAAHHPTMIKRYLRHPMLAGVFLWAVSHLLTNGTERALLLFGAIGLWALIEIPLINRREGPYQKPDAPDFSEELKGVFISAAIFIIALILHPYFAGVTPFPR